MPNLQGMVLLLFASKENVSEALGLLLAGLFWMLWGRRKSGELRWYHAGWTIRHLGPDGSYSAMPCDRPGDSGVSGGRDARIWFCSGKSLISRAVYGGGVALVGLALAVGGRRLDSPRKTESQ